MAKEHTRITKGSSIPNSFASTQLLKDRRELLMVELEGILRD
jgi:hypothetical protein